MLRLEVLEERALLSAGTADTLVLQPLPSQSPQSFPGPTGLTPSQIRRAYGFDKVQFQGGGISGDGGGQTIAIIVAYHNPKLVADLNAFSQAFNIPASVNVRHVAQDGTTNYPGTDAAWAAEASLDVQWAHALAPGAELLVVEATSPETIHLFAAVDYARRQPGVSVVSLSFGGDEFAGETGFDPVFQTPPGHAGVSFVAASGDDGSPPSYPATSPFVLAAGGTTLSVDEFGNYLGETGWSNSGGGVSQYEPLPAYQQGFVPPTVQRRGSPDVAFNADPASGVAVYDSFNNPTSSPWVKMGGTSLAAPAWAAIIAMGNQGRALGSSAALDGASGTLPRIYGLPQDYFNDIITGNNGFPAGPGYDFVTGRGSPKADLIAYDLGDATASITGTAYIDQDGNGAFDHFSEFGRSGVPVELYKDVNRDGIFQSGLDQLLSTQLTSAGFGGIGQYRFDHLVPGMYVVRVNVSADVQVTEPAPNPYYAVTVSLGQMVADWDFGLFQFYSVHGHVFDDLDGNGHDQFGFDQGLNGYTVELYKDTNHSGSLDPGIDVRVAQTVTATLDYGFGAQPGGYAFTGLGAGTYFVREVLPARTMLTTPPAPGHYRVRGDSGEDVWGLDFGNFRTITLSGMGFDDLDGDGGTDGGSDHGWNGITIQAYRDENDSGRLELESDALVGLTVTTSSRGFDGLYSIADLGPGTYFLLEAVPAGATQTAPVQFTPPPGPSMPAPPMPGPPAPGQMNVHTVLARSGQDIGSLDFGNFRNILLSGRTYEDRDGDGTDDNGTDPAFGEASVTLYRDADGNGTFAFGTDQEVGSATTTAEGLFSFPNLGPGTYFVAQAVVPGAVVTAPVATPGGPIGLGGPPLLPGPMGSAMPSPGWHTIPAQSGHNVADADFGNFRIVAIGGRVFTDLDGSGTDNGGSDPGLNHVVVDLFRDVNHNGSLDTDTDVQVGSRISTPTADDDGSYEFAGLGPGPYILRAMDSMGRVQTTPGPPGTHVVAVTSGVDEDDCDFGFVDGPNPAFIFQTYIDLLYRPVEPTALVYWNGLLSAGMDRSGVVQTILNSQEYQVHLVQDLYRQYLDRDVDPSGLASGLQLLRVGPQVFPGLSGRDALRMVLVSSDEYFFGSGGGSRDGFVAALARDVLHRDIDPSGASYYGGLLARGVSRQSVARTFLVSTEAKQFLVQDCYQQYLRREADNGGLAYFTGVLQRGGREEDVIAFMAASDEYYRRL